MLRKYTVIWARIEFVSGPVLDNFQREDFRAANHNQARLLAASRIAPEGFEPLGVTFNDEWLWQF